MGIRIRSGTITIVLLVVYLFNGRIISIVILGEQVTFQRMIGIGFTIGGIILIQQSWRRDSSIGNREIANQKTALLASRYSFYGLRFPKENLEPRTLDCF